MWSNKKMCYIKVLIISSTISFIGICFLCDVPLFNAHLRSSLLARPWRRISERGWEVAKYKYSTVIQTVIQMNHSFLQTKTRLVPNFNWAFIALQCFPSFPSITTNLSLFLCPSIFNLFPFLPLYHGSQNNPILALQTSLFLSAFICSDRTQPLLREGTVWDWDEF